MKYFRYSILTNFAFSNFLSLNLIKQLRTARHTRRGGEGANTHRANTSIVIEINSRPGIVPIFHENRESPFHRVPQLFSELLRALTVGVDFRGRLRWTYALTTTTGGILKGRGKRGQQTGLKSSTTLGQWRNHSLINYSIFRYPWKERSGGGWRWNMTGAPNGIRRITPEWNDFSYAPCCVTFLSSIISIWQGSMPFSFFFFLYFSVGWFFVSLSCYSNNKGIIFAAFNNNESLLQGFETNVLSGSWKWF